MSERYQIINARIGSNFAPRHWLALGQPMVINGKQGYRLMSDRRDGRYVAILAEEFNGQFVRNHLIEDRHWICDHIRSGYLEIIPKVLRYDTEGRVDAVLIELLHTPAAEMVGL